MKGRGGEGTRTSAAMWAHEGNGCGGAPLRRTFAVGRLTRRSAEIQLAPSQRRRGSYLLRAVIRARATGATVH